MKSNTPLPSALPVTHYWKYHPARAQIIEESLAKEESIIWLRSHLGCIIGQGVTISPTVISGVLVWRLKISSGLPTRAIISRDLAPHVEHKKGGISASSLHQNIRTSVRLLPLGRPFTSNRLVILQAFTWELKPINYSCVYSSYECLYLSSLIDTTLVTSRHPSLPTAIHVSASDPGLHRATMVLENEIW